MNKKLRVLFCMLFAAIAICALAFIGCSDGGSSNSGSDPTSTSTTDTGSGSTDTGSTDTGTTDTGSSSTDGSSSGDSTTPTAHTHSYSVSTAQVTNFTQNSDGSYSATVTLTCATCGETATVTGTATYESTTLAATCTTAGKDVYTINATVDGTPYTINHTVTTPATGHQHVTPTEAVAATATTGGSIAYWYCSDCGKYFSDSACTQEITNFSEYKVWTAQTGTTLKLGDNILEAETTYSYTVAEEGYLKFTISGDSDYASVYSSETNANNSLYPYLVRNGSSSTDNFTISVSQDDIITIYIVGGEIFDLKIETTDEAPVTVETSVPENLVIDTPNTIILAADDAKKGVTSKFTTTDAGYYTFTLSNSGNSWVYINNDNSKYVFFSADDYNKLSYEQYFDGNTEVSLSFYSYDSSGVDTEYTITITYSADSSSGVNTAVPTVLNIGGNTEATLSADSDTDYYYYLSYTVTTAGHYTFLLSGEDIDYVSVIIYAPDNDRYYLGAVSIDEENPTATMTTIVDFYVGSDIWVYAYVSSGSATFTLATSCEADSTVVDPAGYSQDNVISNAASGCEYERSFVVENGTAIYLSTYVGRQGSAADMVLSISGISSYTVYYCSSTEYNYTQFVTDSETGYTVNGDGTYSFNVAKNSTIYLKIVAGESGTITIGLEEYTIDLPEAGGSYTLAESEKVILVVQATGSYTFTIDNVGEATITTDDDWELTYTDSDGYEAYFCSGYYFGTEESVYTVTIELTEGMKVTVVASAASTITITSGAAE